MPSTSAVVIGFAAPAAVVLEVGAVDDPGAFGALGVEVPVAEPGAAEDPGAGDPAAGPGLFGAPGARDPVAVPGATERCPKIADAILPKTLMAISCVIFL
jgi:hypothetical protein